NVDLVRQLLDGVGAQRDEPVEARDERDVLRLAPQLVPGARRGRSVELPGKEVQRAFVDRPHRDSCIGHLPQREEGSQYSIRDCTAPAMSRVTRVTAKQIPSLRAFGALRSETLRGHRGRAARYAPHIMDASTG